MRFDTSDTMNANSLLVAAREAAGAQEVRGAVEVLAVGPREVLAVGARVEQVAQPGN